MANRQRNSQLSFVNLLLLALLGVPRVIAHDLHWVEPGSLANMLLVFVPPVIWVAVALRARTPRPFQSLLAVGIIYGVLLGITHQLLWHNAFPTPPELGGNLSDLSPTANAVITRLFAFFSSLFTGAAAGVITGLVAQVLKGVLQR
ncbi:hypothetical protein DUZ99_15215 [Xylanibacillus composti]|uniref:Uncharacterized protein n=1 Tax=Xylanibacillus composti TaxID=1572762 RepID=A0A8J4H6J1_9BACL|nr:hypothetical protein [Xylanibacillus composti]MDT9726331.1 hypothetical protein [Xylanibacillus composti]GIQ70561.1 hypothetical protein XYCOK13_33850 [Xylanibacillus composti]